MTPHTIQLGRKRLVANRVFCIGRNYAKHARELGNRAPKTPTIFLKPAACLVAPGKTVPVPTHGRELHHEVELVILVGKKGRPKTETQARSFAGGISVGLDLTLRDVQNHLISKGLPWEICKAFEKSAPLGTFVTVDRKTDWADIPFSCAVNGKVRQEGNSGDMVFSVPKLLVSLGKIWTLEPGDLIYTGTPHGVGRLRRGDRIVARSPLVGSFSWRIS